MRRLLFSCVSVRIQAVDHIFFGDLRRLAVFDARPRDIGFDADGSVFFANDLMKGSLNDAELYRFDIDEQFVVEKSRRFIIDVDMCDIQIIAVRDEMFIIEIDLMQVFHSPVFEEVQINRIVYVAVRIAFIGAYDKRCRIFHADSINKKRTRDNTYNNG